MILCMYLCTQYVDKKINQTFFGINFIFILTVIFYQKNKRFWFSDLDNVNLLICFLQFYLGKKFIFEQITEIILSLKSSCIQFGFRRACSWGIVGFDPIRKIIAYN